jgi:hypothetical protein
MLLQRLFGLHDTYIDKHLVFTNFVAIPATAIFVLALLDKRANFNQGKITYVQGLVCVLIITLIVTIFSPLTQVLTSLVITPHYFQNAIDYAVSWSFGFFIFSD